MASIFTNVVFTRPDIENAKHQCELWFPEFPRYMESCRQAAHNGKKFNSPCDYIEQAQLAQTYKSDTGKDCYPERTAAEAAANEKQLKKIVGFVIAAIIAFILILKNI